MSALIRFASFASLHKAAAEQLARGGLYVPVDLALAQFAAVDVDVETPDGERFAIACEVLQAFPGTATALAIKPAGRSAVDALLAHAHANPADGDPTAAMEVVTDGVASDDDDAPAEAPPAPSGEPGSLAAQVAEMSVNEKRQAALHGGKDMRLLILKDHNKTLHPFVMRNPAISLDEVEAASRLTSLNPEVLHIMAREWTRSSTVVRNLVKNPKTPMTDALAMVDKLAPADVRAIVKSNSVRMPILMAARKRLNS